MACKGICKKYRVDKSKNGGHYALGHKRCQLCEIFIKWKGLFCPCCNYRLRTLPRNAKYKDRFKEKKIEIKMMMDYLKEHDPEMYQQFVDRGINV